jgi:anti-anti-sigma regulatory factor
MAKNFSMLSEKMKNHSVRIKLQGDFDGTSAHELANLLDTYSGSHCIVAIDTDKLNTIHSHGLNVFIIRMKLMRRSYAGIVYTGKHKSSFLQEWG